MASNLIFIRSRLLGNGVDILLDLGLDCQGSAIPAPCSSESLVADVLRHLDVIDNLAAPTPTDDVVPRRTR